MNKRLNAVAIADQKALAARGRLHLEDGYFGNTMVDLNFHQEQRPYDFVEAPHTGLSRKAMDALLASPKFNGLQGTAYGRTTEP